MKLLDRIFGRVKEDDKTSYTVTNTPVKDLTEIVIGNLTWKPADIKKRTCENAFTGGREMKTTLSNIPSRANLSNEDDIARICKEFFGENYNDENIYVDPEHRVICELCDIIPAISEKYPDMRIVETYIPDHYGYGYASGFSKTHIHDALAIPRRYKDLIKNEDFLNKLCEEFYNKPYDECNFAIGNRYRRCESKDFYSGASTPFFIYPHDNHMWEYLDYYDDKEIYVSPKTKDYLACYHNHSQYNIAGKKVCTRCGKCVDEFVEGINAIQKRWDDINEYDREREKEKLEHKKMLQSMWDACPDVD